ncbi:MAG TPA: hypothetical protein VGK54_07130, partial [Chloroflexota bacterium]
MNVTSTLLSGFIATVVLTTLMAGTQELRFTRLNIPFILGAIFTKDRDLAKVLGIVLHFINGWWISFIYAAVFESLGLATWWLGGGMGLVHAAFVLTVIMWLLPGLHPRIASEQRGPTPTRQLEPPGFLALNYGRRTP